MVRKTQVSLRLLRNSEEMFHHLWERYERNNDFALSLSIGQLLQPLGHLTIPEAEHFLWEAFHKAKGANFIFLSATIALARGGQAEAEEAFIAWLMEKPSRRDFVLQWRLFYERNDRSRRDFESFEPGLAPGWDKACGWLLRALTEENTHFFPLRHLYIYTLLEFMKVKGLSPFFPPAYSNGAGLQRALERRRLLSRAVAALELDPSLDAKPIFRAHLEDLKAQAAKLLERPVGGDHEQETKPDKGRRKGVADNRVRERAAAPT